MLSLVTLAALSAGASFALQANPEAAPRTGFLHYQLQMSAKTYRYVVYVPREYSSKTKWPLIVFLHGAGECGTDGQKHIAQGLGTAILWDAARWPFVVVMPQKPEMRDAWEDHEAAVMAMLDETLKTYSIDVERLYLTGLSQGGHGTWVLGARHADRWAAIAPICGYADPADVAPSLKDTPIWCFHGDADQTVPPARSTAIVDAVKAAGGSPKLTVYPGVGHNSWDKAYREEPLAKWFLQHKKPAGAP